MPSVKIAIDIRRMTEFGVGTYIRNVVRTLGRLDHETAYFLIGPPAKVKEIGPLPANFHTVALAEPERSLTGLSRIPHRCKAPGMRLGPYPQSVFRAARAALPLRDDGARHARSHVARARAEPDSGEPLHFQMTKRVLAGRRGFSRSRTLRNWKSRSFSIFPPDRIEVVYNAIDERFLHGHANAADRAIDCRALSGYVSVSALCRHESARIRMSCA